MRTYYTLKLKHLQSAFKYMRIILPKLCLTRLWVGVVGYLKKTNIWLWPKLTYYEEKNINKLPFSINALSLVQNALKKKKKRTVGRHHWECHVFTFCDIKAPKRSSEDCVSCICACVDWLHIHQNYYYPSFNLTNSIKQNGSLINFYNFVQNILRKNVQHWRQAKFFSTRLWKSVKPKQTHTHTHTQRQKRTNWLLIFYWMCYYECV